MGALDNVRRQIRASQNQDLKTRFARYNQWKKNAKTWEWNDNNNIRALPRKLKNDKYWTSVSSAIKKFYAPGGQPATPPVFLFVYRPRRPSPRMRARK
jgi:hypothetical protein